MSPDTTDPRHDSAVAPRPAPARPDLGAFDDPSPSLHGPGRPASPERETGGPMRHGRVWTCLILAAAAAFTGAVTVVGTNLFVQADTVSDTPERSVEALLGALLDEHDATAARTWLCADKAGRDLGEVTAELASFDERAGVDWANVTEIERRVGEATVTADLSTADGSITWTFTLVAEDSDPQWQVCDMAVK